MKKKIAIVTQSYKNDYEECKLLCESIDWFAPDMDHFIFVNDEDYKMFHTMNYSKHIVHRKGEILPWYLVRLPWTMAGHHFHISLFTMPVREWIIQQISKLGVFEIIGDEYDAVLNIDSETVLMKNISSDDFIKDGKYMMYKAPNIDEPSHYEYYDVAGKLFNIDENVIRESNSDTYMNTIVCFEKSNIKELHKALAKKSIFRSWKHTLCNTYRFSEYYTYGIYTDLILGLRNHYLIDYRINPQLARESCSSIDEFVSKAKEMLKQPEIKGIWLQKTGRKNLSNSYLNFEQIRSAIYELWNKQV